MAKNGFSPSCRCSAFSGPDFEKESPFMVFRLLAGVPGGYRPMIPHDPRPDFTPRPFFVLQFDTAHRSHFSSSQLISIVQYTQYIGLQMVGAINIWGSWRISLDRSQLWFRHDIRSKGAI
jgi:hypothetical protein